MRGTPQTTYLRPAACCGGFVAPRCAWNGQYDRKHSGWVVQPLHAMRLGILARWQDEHCARHRPVQNAPQSTHAIARVHGFNHLPGRS